MQNNSRIFHTQLFTFNITNGGLIKTDEGGRYFPIGLQIWYEKECSHRFCMNNLGWGHCARNMK